MTKDMTKSLNSTKICILIFLSFLGLYVVSAKPDNQDLNYFVPLAKSFIKSRLDIEPKPYLNELVQRGGRYYVVYPFAPALVEIAPVMVWGEGFNQKWASWFVGALAVAVFYLLLLEIGANQIGALFLTLFLGIGTNFYFTALVGSAWYFAHICAVFFLILSLLWALKKRPALSGLAFTLAFLSRLPILLGAIAPLYLLLSRSDRKDKAKTAIVFVAIVFGGLAVFLLYNYLRFGSFFQSGYSLISGVLEEPWYENGLFSFSYIFRNLQVLLLKLPDVMGRIPYFLPSNYGMAIWICSPAILALLFCDYKNKAVQVLGISSILIALPSLMHGNPGFTQLGHRFSLDWIVLWILIIAISWKKIPKKIFYILLILSFMVNIWIVVIYKLNYFFV